MGVTLLPVKKGVALTIYEYHQKAVFVSPIDNLKIPQAEFRQIGVTIVQDNTQLLSILNNREVTIVYFHPVAFSEVQPDLLQKLYRDKKVIVVLDTPISQLYDKLAINPAVEDLRADYYINPAYFTVAMIQSNDDPTKSAYGTWFYADFFKIHDFKIVISIIENRLQDISAQPLSCTPNNSPLSSSKSKYLERL